MLYLVLVCVNNENLTSAKVSNCVIGFSSDEVCFSLGTKSVDWEINRTEMEYLFRALDFHSKHRCPYIRWQSCRHCYLVGRKACRKSIIGDLITSFEPWKLAISKIINLFACLDCFLQSLWSLLMWYFFQVLDACCNSMML